MVNYRCNSCVYGFAPCCDLKCVDARRYTLLLWHIKKSWLAGSGDEVGNNGVVDENE